MSERIQHPYACVNKGCVNGFGSIFFGAPPEWFASRGISEPKNCPDCRDWRRSTQDSSHRCADCGFAIPQSANAKKAFHRHEGPYVSPKKCRKCLEGNPPEAEAIQPPARKVVYKSHPRTSLDIRPYDEMSEDRKEHYGKHIPDHPASMVGQPRGDSVVSVTTLVGPGASSVEMFYAGKEIAERTDGGVYQYMLPNGKIVKATIVDGDHIEASFFRRRSDGKYEFLTSYDEVPVDNLVVWFKRH
ncbi:MAG TPA: hypothetical protein VJ841_05025 [Candidatus Saccharimonadales bacterium]|nr:hypothetical protein [Candidatus Saccharimonadales bacterium]